MADSNGEEGGGPWTDFSSSHRIPDWADRIRGRVALRLENYRHIELAYGRVQAEVLLLRLRDRLHEWLGARAGLRLSGEVIEIQLPGGGGGGVHGEGGRQACGPWLPALCRALTLTPVETGEGAIHGWVAGQWWPGGEEGCSTGEETRAHAFVGPDRGTSAHWPAQYRRDMALASKTLADLGAPGGAGAMLAWQAVCDARVPGAVLYRQGLIRMLDEAGQARPFRERLLALERLGFAPLVDGVVVGRILDELEAAPHVVLAARISAQSARTDSWWAEIEARLIGQPRVACRLVLEIGGTTPLPDIAEAVVFVDRARRAQCGIALADVGKGYLVLRDLLALAPDVAKLDRMFLADALSAGDQGDLLAHLAGLARSTGAMVVIEGVDTPRDAERARAAGIVWHQGRHAGRPAWGRPWRLTPSWLANSPLTALRPREGLFATERRRGRSAAVHGVRHQGQFDDRDDAFRDGLYDGGQSDVG